MSTPKTGGGNLLPVKLPAVTNGQLPAVAKAARPLRALNGFASRADDLSWFAKRGWKNLRMLDSVCRCPWSTDAQMALDEAGKVLDLYDSKYRKLAEQLKLDRQHFNPADAYDDDDDESITEERVHMHIRMLLASFPNANPGNAEAYLGAMVEEVLAAFPSVPALESACSHIRKTVKFPPTIAEVIEAIDEQNDLWSDRFMAISDCATCAESLRTELKIATELVAAEQLKREEQLLAAEEKKRAADELRATPLVVGVRVRWRNDKPFDPTFLGTITKQWQSSDGFDVFFDIGRSCYAERKDLERVIPGDRGYEVSAEVQKKQRALRPVVGDRVTDDIPWRDPECQPCGAGTVLSAGDFDPDGYDDGFTVQFDNGVLGSNWMAIQLQRLLPGDPDFAAIALPSMDTAATGAGESACAVSCEEATTLAPHSHNSTGVAAARSGAVSHERSNKTESSSE
jgi:hypothetical protein